MHSKDILTSMCSINGMINTNNSYTNNIVMHSINNAKRRGSISALTQQSEFSASEGVTFLLTALIQLSDVICFRYVEMMQSMSCLCIDSNV